MFEVISNEYERSISCVRKRKDRAYQIARISGVMLSIFGAAVLYAILRVKFHEYVPILILILSVMVHLFSGIILPISFAYDVLGKHGFQSLGVGMLELARKGKITDRVLASHMNRATRENRRCMKKFNRKLKRAMFFWISSVLTGLIAITLAWF